MPGISDDAKRNREDWTQANAAYTDARASPTGPRRRYLGRLRRPGGVARHASATSTGLDVVELGCGTAYVSAWLARRGARPVGVDVTPAQLATARRCQAEFGLEFPLVEASAEDVPLPSESFDLAVSEYGASIWCDPHLWIPEAYRLLRPGGRLWFLRNSTHLDPLRPRRRASRARCCCGRSGGSAGSSGPASSASSGSCLTASSSPAAAGPASRSPTSFELYAPDDAVDHAYYDTFSAEWARKWPAEEIWVAKKPG